MAGFTAQVPELRGTLDDNPQSIPLVLLPTVGFTATANGEFSVGPHVKVVEAVVVQTSGTATPAYTVGIDGWNPAAGAWENLITSASVATTGAATTVVQVNPLVPPISNSSAQRVPRRRMRVVVTHTNANAAIYSVDVHAAS